MHVTQTADQLSSRVRLLAQRFDTVSEQLAATAREMAAGGNVPAVALSDALDTVRSEFAELRRLAIDLAGTVGMTIPEPDQLGSLSGLESLIASTSETIQRRAAEEARQAAVGVLERVALVRHRDEPDYPPLGEAQSRAEGLRATIATLDGAAPADDVPALAEDRHPFGYLVEFAQPRPDLDDERWGLMHDAVASYFGRPLAVAAARGKLVFGDMFDDGPSSSHTAEDEWPTLTIDAAAPKRPPPDSPQAVDSPRIDDLVWRALLADRPAVAFQLASYLRPQDDAPARPPQWLLRALTLGRHLLHVNGDLALQLTEAFAQFQATDLRVGEAGDEARALRLLLFAASLRPSLIAPDTGAWHILGALPVEPGFADVHRYSRVVSEYGERHPPFSPYAFAASVSTDAWRDNLEDLLRGIGAWRVRFLGMRSSFPPAREVWRCWLRPDGLIHSLLAPLTLDPGGLETARGLAERLSNAAQVRWEIGHTDRRVLGRTAGPDVTTQPAATGDLTDRVGEAVAFARRWIVLQEHRPGRPDDGPLRQANKLRQDLSELRPAVLRELEAADAPEASLALRAAVKQCVLAVSGIDALLGTLDVQVGNPGQPREEPPSNLLLSRDLLRVPGLELDAHGRPRGLDDTQLVVELEKILLDDQPTWQEAFQAHLRRHDHAATAQIIQCIDMDEHARQLADPDLLRSARADDLQRCRDVLRRQIEATRRSIDTAAAQGGLTETLRGELLASVEPVGVGLSTVLQFEPEFTRLQRIRDQLPEPRDDEEAVDDDVRSSGGRVRERLELAAADGPCLVVGAPGVGMADLFQRMAQQGNETLVVDLNVEGTAVSDEHDTDRFWRLAGEFLHDPARQGLLLVDAADGLLEEEAQTTLHAPPSADGPALFPTSSRLATYMRERNGRLKIVLGGSATVLRAARLVQHPLFEHGYVQLGPLLDGGDWRAARVLLQQALAGVEPESKAVVARILSLANYEPSSICRLAGALAGRCSGRTVTDLDLDQLMSSRDGARILIDTLQTTLACDPRFSVVMYSLALAYVRGLGAATSIGADGVSAAWLREQALMWWPNGFRDSSSVDAFKDVLDQMVSLGVLRPIGPDRFVPGRPNLLQFLGSEEELIARLNPPGLSESDEVDSDHDYAPAWFRPKLAGGLAERSPLTNQQISALVGPATGCAIVFGTEAGGLLSLTRLGALAGARTVVTLQPPPGEADSGALLSAIDAELARHDARLPVVMIVPPGWTWSGQWLTRVHEHLAQAQVDRAPVPRIVFIADPATAARLVEDLPSGSSDALTWLAGQGVDCITLAPWRDSAVSQWMINCGLDAETRTHSDLTGNWPLLLETCCPDSKGGVASRDAWLHAIELRLASGMDGALARSFGLDLPVGRALQQLAAHNDSQDIEVGLEMMPAALEWASLLHLAHPVGANRWRLDPVVARLLQPLPDGQLQLRQHR